MNIQDLGSIGELIAAISHFINIRLLGNSIKAKYVSSKITNFSTKQHGYELNSKFGI